MEYPSNLDLLHSGIGASRPVFLNLLYSGIGASRPVFQFLPGNEFLPGKMPSKSRCCAINSLKVHFGIFPFQFGSR
jgi:hypothetical protein